MHPTSPTANNTRPTAATKEEAYEPLEVEEKAACRLALWLREVFLLKLGACEYARSQPTVVGGEPIVARRVCRSE
eukprot:COSAG06_NODE_20814_length_780_cov_1.038179_1_plen_74_part_10